MGNFRKSHLTSPVLLKEVSVAAWLLKGLEPSDRDIRSVKAFDIMMHVLKY